MLASSLSFDSTEDPFDDGRELPLRNVLKGLESRPGDLGAVNGEKPEGGFAVRMTGAVAANSSSESSCVSCREG